MTIEYRDIVGPASEISDSDIKQGLANGFYTEVTNLVSSPTDLSTATWNAKSANTTVTANKCIFNAATNLTQIGQGNASISLVAGHEYLLAVSAKGLTSNASTLPSFVANIQDSAGVLSGLDFQAVAIYTGERFTLDSTKRWYTARFISPITSAGQVIFRDDASAGGPFMVDIAYVGMYDITGLTGHIYDPTYNASFSLNTVHTWGDSLSYSLYHLKNYLGVSRLNKNGQFLIYGSQTNASDIITLFSTAGLETGYSISGPSIFNASGVQLTVDSATQISLDIQGTATPVNAGRTLASSPLWVGYNGGGKTSTQILSVFNNAVAKDSKILEKNHVIWMGHNDPVNSVTLADSKANISALINQLTGDFRVLTNVYNIGWTNPRTSSADHIDKLNDWLISTYGDRCVDVRPVLAGASKNDYTDTLNVGWRVTPGSLRTDTIHINAYGGILVSKAIADSVGGAWR